MQQFILIIGALIIMGTVIDFVLLKNKYNSKLKSLNDAVNDLDENYDNTKCEMQKLIDSITEKLSEYNKTLVNLQKYTKEIEKLSAVIIESQNDISKKIEIIADFFEDDKLDNEKKLEQIHYYISIIKNDIKLNNELLNLEKQIRRQSYGQEL